MWFLECVRLLKIFLKFRQEKTRLLYEAVSFLHEGDKNIDTAKVKEHK